MRWTDTGVAVRRGDVVRFTDPRSDQVRRRRLADLGPDGAGGKSPSFPVPAMGVGGLVATRRQQRALPHRVEQQRHHDAGRRPVDARRQRRQPERQFRRVLRQDQPHDDEAISREQRPGGALAARPFDRRPARGPAGDLAADGSRHWRVAAGPAGDGRRWSASS